MVICQSAMPSKAGNIGAVPEHPLSSGQDLMLTFGRKCVGAEINGKAAAGNDGTLAR